MQPLTQTQKRTADRGFEVCTTGGFLDKLAAVPAWVEGPLQFNVGTVSHGQLGAPWAYRATGLNH